MGAENIYRWSVPLQPQRVKKKLNNLILRVASERSFPGRSCDTHDVLLHVRVLRRGGCGRQRRPSYMENYVSVSDCRPNQISESLLRDVVRNTRGEWITETEVCQTIFTETNYEVLRLLFNMRELYDTPLVVLNTTKDRNWKTEKEKSLSDQISHARKCTHLAVSCVT